MTRLGILLLGRWYPRDPEFLGQSREQLAGRRVLELDD